MALDQVVREQERQVIRLNGALALVTQREVARRAERAQLEPPVGERRLLLHARQRDCAVSGERSRTQPLEHPEGHVLGHALGEPLLRAALAARELELRDVRQLVRHETQPFPAAVSHATVQQRASRTRDADREGGELIGARFPHRGILHEAAPERLA